MEPDWEWRLRWNANGRYSELQQLFETTDFLVLRVRYEVIG